MKQYRKAVIDSMQKMGYPFSVASAMIERAEQNKNSAFYGNYSADDMTASARRASRQIIESWYKIDEQEYQREQMTGGIKYGKNYLMPYY